DRITLFDDQSRRLSGFHGRIGTLRLPVDLEQESATLRPLALREHFLDFLLSIFLYGHFDLARGHSLVLFKNFSWVLRSRAGVFPRSEAGRTRRATSSRRPRYRPRFHRQQTLALQFFAGKLAGAADSLRLLADFPL